MSYILPLKNRENRSVTFLCQNSENIYLTFVAYSSNMTSEMT